MRTTLNIDEDVLETAKELAVEARDDGWPRSVGACADPAHVHHEAAHRWFGVNRKYRWATCPLTENAFVRVLSNPAYPGQATTIEDAVVRLRTFYTEREHVFWSDAVSIRERGRFRWITSRATDSSPTFTCSRWPSRIRDGSQPLIPLFRSRQLKERRRTNSN